MNDRYQISVRQMPADGNRTVSIDGDGRNLLAFHFNDVDKPFAFIRAWIPGLSYDHTHGTLSNPETDLAEILNWIFPGNAVAA